MNPGRNKRMSSHHPIRQSTPREPQPRQFTLKTLILPFALLALLCGQASAAESNPPNALAHPQPASFSPLDLAPARWIWYPAERTLPNTVILFRRGLKLDAPPKSARGWILGESRYRLEVNGERVQWGPAPNDPRWPECDPVDLTHILKAGENVLGAAVLFYGHGDGTWPMGLPGFLFRLEIEHADGRKETITPPQSQPDRRLKPTGFNNQFATNSISYQ